MVRPCYLVIDQEYSGSISTRKLVIETAKFNVITAYSSSEAVATMQKYPAVDGVILDAGMPDMPCSELVRAVKRVRPTVPVIVVSSPREHASEEADYSLDSFNPKRLLDLLEKLQPEQTAAIEQRNIDLKAGT